jgi:S-adenosylmethionine:tRNA ribosyltransferase-isomerase
VSTPEPQLSDYTFELPPELIAQRPPEDRAGSRLLLLERSLGTRRDARVLDLPDLVRGDELLVFNNTRVVPARLLGHKDSGGKVELLALEPTPGGFLAMGRASKGFTAGTPIHLERGGFLLYIERADPGGRLEVRLPEGVPDVWTLCELAGEVPLPPYVERAPTEEDKARYQTVFADKPGAVAAPTAGLHFTPELLSRLAVRGCETAMVTLHVGPGTFAPVRVERLADHVMHSERYEVPEATATAIARARRQRRPLLAVGTTVVRTLEAVAALHGEVVPVSGETSIFIREGHTFRAVDQLMTNFHLPASTLLMLVSAFAGRRFILDAYAHAVAERYRFFSYGDGMLIR